MLVESVNTSIHWMQPRDLYWDQMSFTVNDRSRPSISSVHRFGSHSAAHVLAADLYVSTLDASMTPAVIRDRLVIDDGETTISRQAP